MKIIQHRYPQTSEILSQDGTTEVFFVKSKSFPLMKRVGEATLLENRNQSQVQGILVAFRSVAGSLMPLGHSLVRFGTFGEGSFVGLLLSFFWLAF